MMKKIFIVTLLLWVWQISVAQATQTDSGLWIHPFVNYKVNEKWSLGIGSEIRTYQDFSELNQILFHINATYRIHESVDIMAGFSYMGTYRDFVRDELRPWQAIRFHFKIANGKLILQQKFEERFYPEFNQIFSLRSRTLLGLTVPLMKKHNVNFSISEELFLHTNNTDWGSRRWLD